MNWTQLIPLETYYYPDHNPLYYDHWTRYMLLLREDGYQKVEFCGEIICEGYELEVNMKLINIIQYWAYGKRFSSKAEMNKACKNKAFW